MTTINDLPDDCLVSIFRHIPLRRLIHVIALVNTRWAAVFRLVARQTRSILLLGTESSPNCPRDRNMFAYYVSLLPSFYHLDLALSATSDAILSTFPRIA